MTGDRIQSSRADAQVPAAEFYTSLEEWTGMRRAHIREAHKGGAHSSDTMSAITQMVDDVVRSLFDSALYGLPGVSPDSCSVVAVGGYGRGEMCPGSDVDLLFLCDSSREIEALVRQVLHRLWDLRFVVGHSLRTVRQCAAIARTDGESMTAMLDSRYIAGNSKLFGRLEKALSRLVSGRCSSAFIRQKLIERQTRHARYGMTVQLLEPNVKESPGGLRDVQTAGWILKARRGTDDLSTLIESRTLSKRDAHLYFAAIDFLRRTRIELHFLTDRKHDALDHELQPDVARGLGYADAEAGLGVEVFMRDYYLHARNVRHITDLLCRRLSSQSQLDAGEATPLTHRARLDLPDGILVAKGELHLPRRHREFFASDPSRLVGVFLDALKCGAELNEELLWEIKRHLDLVDDPFRSSPAIRDVFLDILGHASRVATTLRLMHEVGLLGAYLPEFGRLTCLVQYDLYHIYTTDEHSLVAVGNVEELASQSSGQLAHLREVLSEVSRREILYLGVLFHDLGKADRKDHVPAGVRIARGIIERWGLPRDDGDLILFLIENHLLLAEVSQRRDIEDEAMILELSRRFPSAEALRMLYLLTYADLSSLAEAAWNDWRAFLLRDLYDKLLECITLGEQQLAERNRADEASRLVVDELGARVGKEKIRGHLSGLPPHYSLANGAAAIERHLHLIDELEGSVAAAGFTDQEACSEIVVCTYDKPYRLSEICGVFAVSNVSVLGAQVYTRVDGVVLDIFSVTDLYEGIGISPEKQERIRRLLTDVLGGAQDIAELVRRHPPPWSPRRSTTPRSARVVFEHAASERCTIVDIFAQDSIGLLYRITRAISDLGLEITSAKISTQVDQIADSFYVTERGGGKVNDLEKLERIRARLVESAS